jgi:hypothetical protein
LSAIAFEKRRFFQSFFLRILNMSFAQRFGRGLVAAMESETVDAEPVEEVMAADSAETSLVEAADAGAAIDAEVTQIESAQADSDTLGEIADTLEASEETGGLDPVAAELTEVAIESIYSRLGIVRKEKPAMEAFGDKQTRVRATQIAVEDIKARMKQIWEAIVAAFMRVADWLKNFFAAVMDSNEKLAQRADALEKKAGAIAADATQEKTDLPSGGIAKSLGTNGAFDKGAVLKGVEGLASAVKGAGAAGSRADFKDIKGMVQDQAKFDGFTLAASSGDGFTDSTEEAGAPDMKIVTSGHLPGNKIMRLRVAAKELKGAEAVAALTKYSVEVATDGKAEQAKQETVPALTKDEAKKLAGAVRNLTKAVLEGRKTQNALESKIKSLTSDARSAATLAPKDEAEAAARARSLSKAVTASLNFDIKYAASFTSLATSTAKSALDYAERSLALYKPKKEDKAAA